MQTDTAPPSSPPKLIPLSRQWITPLLASSFLLAAVTGILLLLKIHLDIIKPVHEWLCWLLVIASVLHIILNFEPLRTSLSQRPGKAIAVIFVLLTLCSLLPLGIQDNRHGQGGHRTPAQDHTDQEKHLTVPTVLAGIAFSRHGLGTMIGLPLVQKELVAPGQSGYCALLSQHLVAGSPWPTNAIAHDREYFPHGH